MPLKGTMKMDLLNNKQDNDLRERITGVLGQVGLTENEMETARKFLDFSKELDISLLETLRVRELNYNAVHYNSCRLFQEMVLMPNSRSMEATDRSRRL